MRSADARARLSPLGVPRRGTDEQARSDATRRGRRGYFARRARSDATRRARSDVLRPAPPMRTKVNRLNRFPASLAWCMSLSYSQCRAAVDGFVARLHSIIHPAGGQPSRRTRGARHGTHSSADGTFKRFRIGLRSSSWLRLLFLESSAGISAGIRGLCGRPHCRQLLHTPPRRGLAREGAAPPRRGTSERVVCVMRRQAVRC